VKFHNINEDVVIKKVDEIFEFIKEGGNPEQFSFSEQCRIDTICYVLNRVEPHYIVSSRGVARFGLETAEYQQLNVDITALVYSAIKQVNQNKRFSPGGALETAADADSPIFNIPTILGRVLNGLNFAPMSDMTIELRYNEDGQLTPMIDGNWQNPCKLVSQTLGTFTFWPGPVSAPMFDLKQVFEFTLTAMKEGFETISHSFETLVTSELQHSRAFSMDRTLKLRDLYMFPVEEGTEF
jgi:competence protein ComFB